MRTNSSIALSLPLLVASFAISSAALAQEETKTETEARTNETGARADTAEAGAQVRAVPSVPADSPSGMFGSRGQLAISSDTGLSLTNTSVSGVDGSTTSLLVRPAVDYFVIDYLSVGGFLGLEYNSTPGGSSTSFSIGPRVGYNIPFSRRFSAWPKVGLSFGHTSQKFDDPLMGEAADDESNTSIQLNLFLPVMFHPVEHFFLGLGPAFDLDLSGDNKATVLAVRLTLGGWLD